MIRRAWRGALLTACVCLQAELCMGQANAQEQAPTGVVASIRPLALLARALLGNAAPVRSLPGIESSPHDFVLLPSELAAIRSARVFLWMGPALERPLARLLERTPQPNAFRLLPDDGEAPDPHQWLDPRLASAMARAMSGQFVTHGLLEHEAADAALARFEANMQAREQAIDAAFAGLRQVPFAVMHDGLRPFVQRFALTQVGALPATHERQPGARSIAALRQSARAAGAVCLFRERTDSAHIAAVLSEGTAMRVVELDTLARDARDDEHGFDQFLADFAGTVATCLRAAPGDRTP